MRRATSFSSTPTILRQGLISEIWRLASRCLIISTTNPFPVVRTVINATILILCGDKDGRLLSLNPFFFGADNPGNGYDIYCLRDGWASAPSSRDGGGFSSTFFGGSNGAVVPYNGWLFFPATFVTDGYAAGSTKAPITGRYWELNGEPWPGSPPAGFLSRAYSETSWRLLKNCAFGGMMGAPAKHLDAILSVHGYISQGAPSYASNMAHGHLEVFYFTRLYGVTRWEVWTPLGQLGDRNKPSELRAKALNAARTCGRPIPAAGEKYFQPGDLPATPENRFITTTFAGEDGITNTYAITDIRDWSAVTILASLQPPPPCPLPEQNLLANFHFDHATFSPWQKSADSLTWELLQSQTALDTQYTRHAADSGVRYLALHIPGDAPSQPSIYQDIPVRNLRSGFCSVSLRVRSGRDSAIRLLLQQLDANRAVLSTDIDSTHATAPRNSIYTYGGGHDPGSHASVVLSSNMVTSRAQITLRPKTSFLRFTIEPQGVGEFDIIDANVSL